MLKEVTTNYIIDKVIDAMREAGERGMSESELQDYIYEIGGYMKDFDFVVEQLTHKRDGRLERVIRSGNKKFYRIPSVKDREEQLRNKPKQKTAE